MNKIFHYIQIAYSVLYFLFFFFLRLFRIISQESFVTALFGKDSGYFKNEDVSIKKTYAGVKKVFFTKN